MLVQTMMCPPRSRMDILQDAEVNELVNSSQLVRVYNQTLDRQSAFEILNERIQNASNKQQDDSVRTQIAPGKPSKPEPTTFDKLIKSPVVRSVGIAVAGAITRSLLGSLGLKTRASTRKSRY